MRFSDLWNRNLVAHRTKIAVALIAMVAGSAVTGCEAPGKKVNPLAGGGGLSGRWVSADSVFTAVFSDGSFVSTANDTGETLSTGSYVVLSVNEVQLDWTGNLSRQQNRATCQRPSVEVLNCTDQAGRAFSLQKVS